MKTGAGTDENPTRLSQALQEGGGHHGVARDARGVAGAGGRGNGGAGAAARVPLAVSNKVQGG